MGKIYGQDKWERLLSSTIQRINELALLKGGEYAGDLDRLANFRRNGETQGLLPEQIWGVYAGKHWDAVMQYIRDLAQGVQRKRGEPISGRLDDLIVYAILMKAMVEEREDAAALPAALQAEAAALRVCSHEWHRTNRYTDTCVFCSAMRPHQSRS